MSISPASGSSSSSQSSSESWQPSQEANFQTASVRGAAGRSQLRHPHERLDEVVAEDRPVLADEQRARAGSARSGRPRTSCCARATARSRRRPRRARAAPPRRSASSPPARTSSPPSAPGSKTAAAISRVTTPTRPRQPSSAASTVTPTATPERPPPLLELVDVEQLGGRAAAVQHAHARRSARGRASSSWIDRAAAARARCPPATTTTSRPSASATGQARPNGPRTPDDVARPRGAQRTRHRADRAHGVDERRVLRRPIALTEIGTSPAPNA